MSTIMETASLLDDTLIGSFYEHLTSDEPWKDALEGARVLLDASNLMLRISSRSKRSRDSIFAYGPKVDQDKIRDWEDQLYREIFPVTPAVDEVSYFRWEDTLKDQELIRYMNNYDSSWTIIHCFDDSESTQCFLIGSRDRKQNQFSRKDGDVIKALGRHLRRALQLRRKYLRLELISNFQSEGLDRLAIAGALLDQSGNAILLNKSASKLISNSGVLHLRDGHIHAPNSWDDRKLQKMIGEILSGNDATSSTRAMSLSGTGSLDVGIVIRRRSTISVASGKPELSALLFVRSVGGSSEIDAGLVRQMFNFTPAEARLAVGLAKGMKLKDLELELNIRHNTARAHLRSMFLKVDVSRQSQLIHLLSNCAVSL
ncbi:helix-turn-helix transcriptional regulator [Rhizorhabdus argentea]|uniref:helix-turn-helix transcriptional regulator n=1 Tax=Rhizorhabdus argentea TaxID=1387174 RepID=UPI0030EB7948